MHTIFTVNDMSEWASLKNKISDSLVQLYNRVEANLPPNVEKAWSLYVELFSKNDIVHDLTNFKPTPATATVAVTTIATLLLLGRFLREEPKKPEPKKKKKQSKAKKANKEIQHILDFVEETYVPQIDDYLENFDLLPEADREYKFKYYDEMLLKELMKLDGVDVAGNDVLRENRKKVIRFIQEHQRRLDKFKKDRM